jgi:hypothetical protein
MELQIEVTFGMATDQPSRQALDECIGALLDLEGGPIIGFEDTETEVHIRNTSELGDGFDGFVRSICGIPIRLMKVVKLHATLMDAILASNSLQPQEEESSFFSGTFEILTDVRTTPTMTDRLYTKVAARPAAELVFVTHEFQPCKVPPLNTGAFLNALSQVTHNVALTRTTSRLIEAIRSKDERRVGRHAKKLYHLIASELPKGS